MKKILLVVFLLASVIADSNAQRVNFDSLKRVLAKKSVTDTSKVTVLGSLADAYSDYKPDSSMYYSKQLINWAVKHNDVKLLANAREGIAYALYVKGDYAGSLDMALLGLPSVEKYRNNNLANTYNLIGNIYKGQENYPKALFYYRQCLVASTAAKDTTDMSYGAFNLGEVFMLTNVLDSATYYAKKALIYDHINHDQYKDIVLDLWGNIYEKRKDYKNAISYLRRSYTLAQKKSDFRTQAISCISTANYYKRLNNTDSVIYWAKKGLAAAKIVSTNKIIYQGADLLSSAYESQNQTDSAFKYLKLSAITKDSLYSTSKFQAIDALNAGETRRNAEIANAKAAYQTNLRFYLMLFVIGVILLVAFFLWRNSRAQRKTNEKLNEQNEEILAQRDEIGQTLARLKSTQTQLIQSEKMASLGELTAGIAHEIQNPLNFVNNFSDVSAELIDEMDEELDKGDIEEARAIAGDIKQNLEKIRHHGRRADSIVKGMLEHSRTGGGEKQMVDMNALADEFLRLSYHGLRAKDKSFNAEMITHFDPELPKISVIPQDMGRVMLNLFNNAFYAVNQKSKIEGSEYKPTITITTFASPSGGWGAKVHDNGNGIPDSIKDKIMQPFFTTKPTGEGTGLGLSLSYDIVVKGHGGKISVDTIENEFTELIMTLPAILNK